jgi:6-phosphogluconate dehydrogenase
LQVTGATARAAAEGLSSQFTAFDALAPFVAALATPRRIILLVPAGKPVDGALSSLGDVLDAGDVVMDGGNEWFENTVGLRWRGSLFTECNDCILPKRVSL